MKPFRTATGKRILVNVNFIVAVEEIVQHDTKKPLAVLHLQGGWTYTLNIGLNDFRIEIE